MPIIAECDYCHRLINNVTKSDVIYKLSANSHLETCGEPFWTVVLHYECIVKYMEKMEEEK